MSSSRRNASCESTPRIDVTQKGKLLYSWEQNPNCVKVFLPLPEDQYCTTFCNIARNFVQVGATPEGRPCQWFLSCSTGGPVDSNKSEWRSHDEIELVLVKAMPGSLWKVALLDDRADTSTTSKSKLGKVHRSTSSRDVVSERKTFRKAPQRLHSSPSVLKKTISTLRPPKRFPSGTSQGPKIRQLLKRASSASLKRTSSSSPKRTSSATLRPKSLTQLVPKEIEFESPQRKQRFHSSGDLSDTKKKAQEQSSSRQHSESNERLVDITPSQHFRRSRDEIQAEMSPSGTSQGPKIRQLSKRASSASRASPKRTSSVSRASPKRTSSATLRPKSLTQLVTKEIEFESPQRKQRFHSSRDLSDTKKKAKEQPSSRQHSESNECLADITPSQHFRRSRDEIQAEMLKFQQELELLGNQEKSWKEDEPAKKTSFEKDLAGPKEHLHNECLIDITPSRHFHKSKDETQAEMLKFNQELEGFCTQEKSYKEEEAAKKISFENELAELKKFKKEVEGLCNQDKPCMEDEPVQRTSFAKELAELKEHLQNSDERNKVIICRMQKRLDAKQRELDNQRQMVKKLTARVRDLENSEDSRKESAPLSPPKRNRSWSKIQKKGVVSQDAKHLWAKMIKAIP